MATCAVSATATNAISTKEAAKRHACERSLIERAQRGDEQAFATLFQLHKKRVHSVCLLMTKDIAEAEDLTQEAFLQVFRSVGSFRCDSAFSTWLYRIAVNTAKNYLATQGRRAPTSTEADAEEAETFSDADQLRDINTPESMLMSKQIAETVNAAMAVLPEELRTAITLREIEGLSYEEIAEMMGCPIGTVRSRIFRAREAIAAKLRPLLDTPEGKRW